jgi:hypothetical protein
MPQTEGRLAVPGAGNKLARLDACDAPKTLHAIASTQKSTSKHEVEVYNIRREIGSTSRAAKFFISCDLQT